ncbi:MULTISPECIES: TIGR04255 family protein [Pseudomonas]|uniref:TIGR04255 family protein n=1 Tax=Pseudomonas TaxID=286 RepID=UPI00107114C9|nr:MULTISPECIES: TIGR04255 family protein [Pseudomonas]QBR30823.1 TIGR04255 family protein [Pseudomonas sp. S150]UZT94331.1 TIGR04255 family protein [Pseudomonas koreensis]
MKIASTDRVIYGKNPLAEVVCQIRFQPLEISDASLEQLQHCFSESGYSQRNDEVSFNVVLEAAEDGSPPVPRTSTGSTIRHYSKTDGTSKVSIGPEFIAYTSTTYQSWDSYAPELLRAVSYLNQEVEKLRVTRIGLRYKDVIERSVLGLDGTPWNELIKPFLLGPLARNALLDEDDFDEDSIESQVSQSLIRLDECKLLLQTSLLTSMADGARAFLIDADFFHEADGTDESSNIMESSEELEALLETLHSNAGALFRRAITEKLHDALIPQ